jgi:D-serine deaminase-like pyridoxal phosphate-dependent protein
MGAVLLMREEGIGKFKCATIAEAVMLATPGFKGVLSAYQAISGKLCRFIRFFKGFHQTTFSFSVVNFESVKSVLNRGIEARLTRNVFLDLNVNMNRTGIAPGENAIVLFGIISTIPRLKMLGLQ